MPYSRLTYHSTSTSITPYQPASIEKTLAALPCLQGLDASSRERIADELKTSVLDAQVQRHIEKTVRFQFIVIFVIANVGLALQPQLLTPSGILFCRL